MNDFKKFSPQTHTDPHGWWPHRQGGSVRGGPAGRRPAKKADTPLGGAAALLRRYLIIIGCLCLVAPLLAPATTPAADAAPDTAALIGTLAAFGDRSPGTAGHAAAAAFIREQFHGLGFETVGSQFFGLPTLQFTGAALTLDPNQPALAIQPLAVNAVSPPLAAPGDIQGPLIYVGRGEMSDFNGKPVQGAIVLMDIEAGRNWLNAVTLGAKALVYLDPGATPRPFFEQLFELTPVRFPRFWVSREAARQALGDLPPAPSGQIRDRVAITSDALWQTVQAENIYCLVPGTDPALKEELLIVEAFYDSTSPVLGRAPGADAACGIATLLQIAHRLKQAPPARSVLLVASDGHDHSQAGMRELVWCLNARSKDLRTEQRQLKEAVNRSRLILELLEKLADDPARTMAGADEKARGLLMGAIDEQIKVSADQLSQQLMKLRLDPTADKQRIKDLAQRRLALKRLSWQGRLDRVTPEDLGLIKTLVPEAIQRQKHLLRDARFQEKAAASSQKLRGLARSGEIAAVVSLHLSSHGSGVGAFNRGWLYDLKPEVNRTGAYTAINEVLNAAARETAGDNPGPAVFQDTLRPSGQRDWQSFLPDRPQLAGEVSALGGHLGITLATTHDSRHWWATPADLPDTVDLAFARHQGQLVERLIAALTRANPLHADTSPADGFGAVSGRANFLRHGEIFPDQPAPGSLILAFQGNSRFYAMVDGRGRFQLKGVADKRHVLHKVIIEGYRFDPASGAVEWAIDKKRTGKDAYRVKMQRNFMETDLVMFGCRESTICGILEPRTFRYLTKINLMDGRREAPPLKYWWSRIDTRASTLASVYLEPGTPYKLTLTDTVLTNKLILTNADATHSEGLGYRIDDWPVIPNSAFHVAKDMWALLTPRIANLERHGVFNEKIRQLHGEGQQALATAAAALADRRYDAFSEAAHSAWALASRVYDQVEATQKDVLMGVLFYIALFVPFAFCMERLLFCFTSIYKRILAFAAILLGVILVIYQVHPAFELAYSPTVVILAFFIMGLSLMVTLIIFTRFEEEMTLLQRRTQHFQIHEISRWKAFVAAFLLGVTNLRRRRLRTMLTCATLVILTFTIMSFTSVKSLRLHSRLALAPKAPYQGFLLKNVNWQDLAPEATAAVTSAFAGKAIVAPRAWLETSDRTQAPFVHLRHKQRFTEARAVVGLAAAEPRISGLDRALVAGRWFDPQDHHAVILPEGLAAGLGIGAADIDTATVTIGGAPYRVAGIFAAAKLQELLDLDGEPVTPATFPSEASQAVTEVEMEAMEAGEDVRQFQSRYQHVAAELTILVPYGTLMAGGGHLKSLAIAAADNGPIHDWAQDLADRFGLSLFSGEPEGAFLYHAGEAMSYSGVPNIVIPLVISVFIVLNTMIGSVFERKREIAVYTSVGLAPSHVGFLFVAEAMAFAVISAVLGYLLAQVSAGIFAGTPLWAGITVNYSSMAGVAAMVLVILVVLVSVTYPAKVASQIAIPDVNRSWKMPEPSQSRIEIRLPFLMSHAEQASAGGYLLAHFKGHEDVSHGLFSAGDIQARFVRPRAADPDAPPPPLLRLNARVWLAPFDFGIVQQVEMGFLPVPVEPRFLELHVRLVRDAGEVGAWGRVNKAFVNNLRKQMLVWRSLDDTTRGYYASFLETTVEGADAGTEGQG